MMNNSTYKLLTQQLHDKDQKMIDQVKELQAQAQRIDFLERLVEKNGQDSNAYRDDIDYRKTGIEFLETMNSYLEAQQDDMLFDPSIEIYKLYEDLCNLYNNAT